MGIEATLQSPLAEAVRRAGGQAPFARKVGLSQGYVHELLREGKPLPTGPVVPAGELNWVLKAERETNVSRHDLRPDLYPRDSAPDQRTPPPSPADSLDRRPHDRGMPGLAADR
jgi:hypothetical protein